MKYFLFNPFLRIAGLRSLLLGWLLILLTSVVAYFSHCHFDGVLDAHVGNAAPFWVFIAEPFVAWLSAVVVLYLAGILVARSSVRFIDIAGTVALSRWPMLLVAFACFIPVRPPQNGSEMPLSAIMLALVMLPFAIWTVVLLYNAYSVSTGAKGNRKTWSFIAALVIAEILSKALHLWLLADRLAGV